MIGLYLIIKLFKYGNKSVCLKFFVLLSQYLFYLVSSPVIAQEKSFYKPPSSFSLVYEPSRPRSVFWAPFVSFILPGFDQWWEHDFKAGAIYSGFAFSANLYANYHFESLHDDPYQREQMYQELKTDPYTKNAHFRRYRLGSQIYQTMGGLSAYHSFRSAITSRWPHGEFTFLQQSDESPANLLLAPFQFKYLLKPSTFIPLMSISILVAIDQMASNEAFKKAGLKRSHLTGEDILFSSTYSFNAGIHEEAMFRGWILPLAFSYTENYFWANFISSSIFALSHLETNSFPIVQGLLGYHLGMTTIENNWSLSEAIFIHTWWDVIAFLSLYTQSKLDSNEAFSNLKISFPIASFIF